MNSRNSIQTDERLGGLEGSGTPQTGFGGMVMMEPRNDHFYLGWNLFVWNTVVSEVRWH